MPEPVISTGAALVGASAWFLNRVLGPSADALGEQIKIYASDRLEKIFRRTEPLVDEAKLEPLPPGFAVQFIQKASVSEDDSTLTELWSNLLADASTGYHSRHPIFADVLSQIGGREAQLIGNVPFDKSKSRNEMILGAREKYISHFAKVEAGVIYDEAGADQMISAIRSIPHEFPGFLKSVNTLPELGAKRVPKTFDSDDRISFDVLERQKILEEHLVRHPFYGEDMAGPSVTFTLLTELGVSLLKSVGK